MTSELQSVRRRQKNGALVEDVVLCRISWLVDVKVCVLILLQRGVSLH